MSKKKSIHLTSQLKYKIYENQVTNFRYSYFLNDNQLLRQKRGLLYAGK